MNTIITTIGTLVALKRVNREELSQAIGMSRPNMVTAFYGRRPLPDYALPRLRSALHLDDDYRFLPTHVQALRPKAGKFSEEEVLDCLRQFTVSPLHVRWTMRGIGEHGQEAVALVLCDARDTVMCLQDNTFTLIRDILGSECDVLKDSHEDVEILLSDFRDIMGEVRSPKDVFLILSEKKEM